MPQTNQKIEVVLSHSQRKKLQIIADAPGVSVREARKARVLLMADQDRRQGRNPDWYIAEQVNISERQVSRIRQQFMREGQDVSLERKTRSDAGIPQKMDGKVEAKLVALCCSKPPQGQQRWTLQLLVDELCRLEVVTSVCRETVRRCLKKSSQAVENKTVLHS